MLRTSLPALQRCKDQPQGWVLGESLHWHWEARGCACCEQWGGAWVLLSFLWYLGIRAFAVTHRVLQLRRELLNEVRSILAMLTAIKQNSLWISMKNLLLLFIFQNVSQSFPVIKDHKSFRCTENTVLFLLSRCSCLQVWGKRGSVHTCLHKCTVNREIAVVLDVDLGGNPLIGCEQVCKKTLQVSTVV